MITTDPGVSLKIMFDFDKQCCFQLTPEYLLNSYREWFVVWVISICICLISCLFASYDKIFAMWLVSVFFFFFFSLLRSRKCFYLLFSPRLLLSNWYSCVIWCISHGKSLFVRKKSTSGKPALYKYVLIFSYRSRDIRSGTGAQRISLDQ